jgi:hypothetical protein
MYIKNPKGTKQDYHSNFLIVGNGHSITLAPHNGGGNIEPTQTWVLLGILRVKENGKLHMQGR